MHFGILAFERQELAHSRILLPGSLWHCCQKDWATRLGLRPCHLQKDRHERCGNVDNELRPPIRARRLFELVNGLFELQAPVFSAQHCVSFVHEDYEAAVAAAIALQGLQDAVHTAPGLGNLRRSVRYHDAIVIDQHFFPDLFALALLGVRHASRVVELATIVSFVQQIERPIHLVRQ